MKILSVDSSAVSASCALIDDKKVIASSFVNTSLTHSQTLMPMIEDMLKNARTDIGEIGCLAINVGPGSFTGIRIGISAVKGLAFSKNLPCVEVSTLECIMMGAVHPFGHYIIEAVMDARCSQVYNAAFEVKNGIVSRLCEDRALKLDELKEELKCYDIPVIFAGDGAEICFNYFNSEFKNIHIADPADRYQNAKHTGLIAQRLFYEGKTVDTNALSVSYLRMPQAQRELKAKQNQ